MSETNYVADQSALEAFVRRAETASWLAVDTEFDREHSFRPRLCLIQVAGDGFEACIDPLALTSLEPLLALLRNREITKVFHAARQDLEVLHARYQCLPRPLFDTQVAAALAGYGEQIAYRTLVSTITGHELGKSHARSDWSARPLSQAQVEYALEDVRYLGALYRQLSEQLASLDRLPWLEEELARLLDPATYETTPDEAWRRLSGANRLAPAARATLKSLAAWRETRAEEQDRPRRKVVTDEGLLALARQRPASLERLQRIKQIPQALARQHGERLVALIRQARDEPPPAGSGVQLDDPAVEAMADALMALVRSRALTLDLPPGLLASRREMGQLAAGGQDLPILRGWRRSVVGEDLVRFLAGDRQLKVENGTLTLVPPAELEPESPARPVGSNAP